MEVKIKDKADVIQEVVEALDDPNAKLGDVCNRDLSKIAFGCKKLLAAVQDELDKRIPCSPGAVKKLATLPCSLRVLEQNIRKYGSMYGYEGCVEIEIDKDTRVSVCVTEVTAAEQICNSRLLGVCSAKFFEDRIEFINDTDGSPLLGLHFVLDKRTRSVAPADGPAWRAARAHGCEFPTTWPEDMCEKKFGESWMDKIDPPYGGTL